jgi:cation:H+ antiporter
VPVTVELLIFGAGAAVSLATSYLLVTRLERIGERLGLSEALLGMLAALAADAPEITSAVAALAQHQQKVGAGVIIGSNVFNLAALLGFGTVAAGSIALHRKVVLLGGVVALWVAALCLVTTTGTIPPAAALIGVLAVLVPYLIVLGAGRARLSRLPVARRWEDWLATAISEEEQELTEIIRPPHGRRVDVLLAAGALVVVVAASVAMERAATQVGAHFAIPQIVTGGAVLAAVTSLPNAVAAVYLAARGRGAAMLSTTLNSNTLNVTAGLLLPATITGLGAVSVHSILIAVWYLMLTVAALAFAYRDSGVRRATGAFIIGAYLVFLGSLLTTARSAAPGFRLTVVPLLVTMAAAVAGLIRRPNRPARPRPPAQASTVLPDPRGPDFSDPDAGKPTGSTDTSDESSS